MNIWFLVKGIHYLGDLDEGDDGRVLVDQITEGQVTWAIMDEEFDTVCINVISTIYISWLPFFIIAIRTVVKILTFKRSVLAIKSQCWFQRKIYTERKKKHNVSKK